MGVDNVGFVFTDYTHEPGKGQEVKCIFFVEQIIIDLLFQEDLQNAIIPGDA